MQYLPPYENAGQTIVTHRVPRALNKYKIPFARPTHVKGPFGHFLTQEFKWDSLAIEQTRFWMEDAALLQPSVAHQGIYLQFMIQGSLPCYLNGFGEVSLTEGLYSLFYLPRGQHKIWFTPGEFVSFYIQLTPSYLRQLGGRYQDVKTLLAHARQGLEEGLQFPPAIISPQVKKLINEIIQCREEAAEREVYLEARIKGIIVLYAKVLAAAYKKGERSYTNDKTMNAMIRYIKENMESKITISLLGKELGLSASTIKNMFKSALDSTLHRYIQQLRMDAAYNLLTTTPLPIGDIAAKVGYPNHSHFTKAFRDYFHTSPEEVRKK